MKINKLVLTILGGIVALGLLGSSALAYAQSNSGTSTAVTDDNSAIIRIHRGGLGNSSDRDQSLADALGIDLETLQAAEETARIALIDQAVADGYLTEEQASQLKLNGGGMMRRGFGGLYDEDEFLADALGISVEELEAAELEAYKVELAAAVADGYLTQAEVDLMLAQKAARNYLDREGLNAQIQAAYEAATNAAVADGAITQAQADALLAQLETAAGFGFGPHGFDGFGGRGGRGGHHGFGLEQLPENAPDSDSTDTTTDTTLDA
jgi:hypothetical protein